MLHSSAQAPPPAPLCTWLHCTVWDLQVSLRTHMKYAKQTSMRMSTTPMSLRGAQISTAQRGVIKSQ